MKKRYVPILTFTVAMVLVGSIAYAADRRKKTKRAAGEAEKLSEEALQVELLSAQDEHRQKKPSDVVKADDARLDELAGRMNEPGKSPGQ